MRPDVNPRVSTGPRPILTEGTVLHCHVPFHNILTESFVRIISQRRDVARIRIGTRQATQSVIQVFVSELELAVTSGMMTPITTLTCDTCEGIMRYIPNVFICRSCGQSFSV